MLGCFYARGRRSRRADSDFLKCDLADKASGFVSRPDDLTFPGILDEGRDAAGGEQLGQGGEGVGPRASTPLQTNGGSSPFIQTF